MRRQVLAALLTIVVVASGCASSGDDIALTENGAASDDTLQTDDQSSSSVSVDGAPNLETEATGTDDREAIPEGIVSAHIMIDQFGYRPGDPKVAVIADPEVGYNADEEFIPGASIEVRRWHDETVVHEGAPQAWADGAVHSQSGDRGWWFDFSVVNHPGAYYLIDVESGSRTGRFEIADGVYDDVLDAALRMFWFNRGNTPHPEDLAGQWSDDAAYIGQNQDGEARSVDDRENDATAQDLSGGWFDAGDTNKYVTFAAEPVHVLLTAYQRHAEVFDDEVGIPESSNGIPDILDEIRWEMDWLGRMQQDDGGVLIKVGSTGFDEPTPPSSAASPRYYEEACSSAAIAAAAMFAHAALVFSDVAELAPQASDLHQRSELAFDWYRANPKRDDCDSREVKAGDADRSLELQRATELVAAVYLWALTGDDRYHDVVQAGFDSTLPFTGGGFGDYGPDQADALLFYRDLDGADPAVVQAIDERLDRLIAGSPLYGFDPDADLYRSFMPDSSYHWGSNRVKASIGFANLSAGDTPGGAERALGHLNYFHGVNPNGLVYLSNMDEFGAERSAESIFHFWFGRETPYDVEAGSKIGPAPGYVVGGPNRGYSGTESPPAGQPPQKSYRDWSGGSEPAWEITEPAIYYQAAYVRLLAAVLAS